MRDTYQNYPVGTHYSKNKTMLSGIEVLTCLPSSATKKIIKKG